MSEPLSDEELRELRDALPILVSSTQAVQIEMDALHWMAIVRLVDEVERSRALLKRIEWVSAEPATAWCPACDGYRPAHKPDCELAALLRR